MVEDTDLPMCVNIRVAAYRREVICGVILNYYRKDYRRTLEILFDNDTWLVDLKQNRIVSGDTEIFCSLQQNTDTYLEQMKYFCRLVKTGAKTSFNSINEAIEILKIGI